MSDLNENTFDLTIFANGHLHGEYDAMTSFDDNSDMNPYGLTQFGGSDKAQAWENGYNTGFDEALMRGDVAGDLSPFGEERLNFLCGELGVDPEGYLIEDDPGYEGIGSMFEPGQYGWALENGEPKLYRVDTWMLSSSESKFFPDEQQARDYLSEFSDGGYEENAKFNGFALYDPENNQISFDFDETFDINNCQELNSTIENRFKIDNAYDLEPEELKELTESLGSKGYTFNPDFNLELDDEFGFNS